MSGSRIRNGLLFLALCLITAGCGVSQRLAGVAGQAAEQEAADRVRRGVGASADAAEDAVLSGDDAEGQAAPQSEAAGPGAPSGSSLGSVSANYDFEAGEETLVHNGFEDDVLGDFPRGFDLIEGSFEIVEWEGGRYLRALSGGIFAIPLPETLPERFTVETAVSVQHGNGFFQVMPGRWFRDRKGLPWIGRHGEVLRCRRGRHPVRRAFGHGGA